MRNPIRRNRNIGTAKSGHSQDNRHIVPQSWHDSRVYWEKVRDPTVLDRRVGDRPIRVIVEPARPGFLYGGTPNDIVAVLGALPREDTEALELVVLRQPTRKQFRLVPVWGRCGFMVEPVHGCSGPGVFLEACPVDVPIRWPSATRPDDRRELRRLESDGHRIERTRREILIHVSPASLRSTAIYRTLLHEVGHLVDWTRSVLGPLRGVPDDSPEADRIRGAYWSRPSSAREDVAHRYATEHADRLRAAGRIPFDSADSDEALRLDRLNPEWFARRHADSG